MIMVVFLVAASGCNAGVWYTQLIVALQVKLDLFYN